MNWADNNPPYMINLDKSVGKPLAVNLVAKQFEIEAKQKRLDWLLDEDDLPVAFLRVFHVDSETLIKRLVW